MVYPRLLHVVMGVVLGLVPTSLWAMGKKEARLAGGIALDESLSAREGEVISRDLNWLSGVVLPSSEGLAELQSTIGLRADMPLKDWLEARVHYLVRGPLDFASQVSIAKRSISFSSPGLPMVEQPTRALRSSEGASGRSMLLSNVGASLYASGKLKSMIVQVNFETFGRIEIRSPRTGIVLVHDAYIPTSRSDSVVNGGADTVVRLAILFHEARHSDGNGRSLGFFHAVCPEGHELAGFNACDRNSNGPYAVSGVVSRELAKACTQCGEKDRAQIILRSLDSFARIIPAANGGAAPRWDDQPESAL